MAEDPQVEELPDGRFVVDGRGLTPEQARLALEFFRSEWGEMVGRYSQEMRRHLMAQLLASDASLVEPASLAQARRQVAVKNRLLESPVFTYETLSEVRHDPTLNATRTAVSRARQERRLFTVTHEGRTLLPAFQFEADGSPRADLAPLLDPLLEAQLGAWQLWTWLTSPASLLSGLIPEQAAASSDPETVSRAVAAARRLAARVPSQSDVEDAARRTVGDVVADSTLFGRGKIRARIQPPGPVRRPLGMPNPADQLTASGSAFHRLSKSPSKPKINLRARDGRVEQGTGRDRREGPRARAQGGEDRPNDRGSDRERD